MMYQIKCSNGYDMQVKGELAWITNSVGQIVYRGSYDGAEVWLEGRGVSQFAR